MHTASTDRFQALREHRYMNLATFRRSGEPVVTPVWFAAEGDRLYVVTLGSTGKAKRIRNNARVTVAPSTARGKQLGEPVEARARILPDAETAPAHSALLRRYGFQYRLARVVYRLRREQPVYLEITPA